MFILYHLLMKKILYLCLTLWISFMTMLSLVSVQATWQSEPTEWHFNQNPVKVLDTVKGNANKYKSEEVQNTQWDSATSRYCRDIWTDPRFTFTRTLCYLKNHSWNYLQYVMFIWLTAATILIIVTWFKLVTSSDREKEISTFKKNLLYITVWIVLLSWFYYLIDIFIGVINLFTD